MKNLPIKHENKNTEKGNTEIDVRRRDRQRRRVLATVPLQVEVTEGLVRRLVADGWLEAEDNGEIRLSRETISKALGEMLDDYAAWRVSLSPLKFAGQASLVDEAMPPS